MSNNCVPKLGTETVRTKYATEKCSKQFLRRPPAKSTLKQISSSHKASNLNKLPEIAADPAARLKLQTQGQYNEVTPMVRQQCGCRSTLCVRDTRIPALRRTRPYQHKQRIDEVKTCCNATLSAPACLTECLTTSDDLNLQTVGGGRSHPVPRYHLDAAQMHKVLSAAWLQNA